MQKIILAIVTCCLFIISQGQSVRLGTYRWKTSVMLTPCDAAGDVDGSDRIPSKPGQLFNVVDNISDKVLIKILRYDPLKKPEEYKVYNINNPDSFAVASKSKQKESELYAYFQVEQSKCLENSDPWYNRSPDLTAGVLTLPLKFRLKDGDFTGSFSFGASGGVNWRASKYRERFHNAVLGIGLTNVTLDEASVSRSKDDIVNNLSAASICMGYFYQSGKVQAGVFLGWDFLTQSNEKRYGWIHQGKPWLSIGFGFSIFGESKEKQTGKTDGEQD